jgi:glutathione synthase
MDPIERINIRGDSTFACCSRRRRAGTNFFITRPTAWRCSTARCSNRAAARRCATAGRPFHARRAKRVTEVTSFDVVLLRQDPPFDLAYITTTHLLERVHPQTLVINDPGVGAQRAGEDVRHRIHRTDAADAAHARPRRDQGVSREHGDIVMKPLYGNGGGAVFRLRKRRSQFRLALRHVRGDVPRALGGPEIPARGESGDKRIILVDGEFAGAVNRVPAADDLRSNMVRGGSPKATDLTPRERKSAAPRAGAARARIAVRRHRRDRRLAHRNQRHLADRHARDQESGRPRTWRR